MPILLFLFFCIEIILLARLAQATGGTAVLLEILVTGLIGYGVLRRVGRRGVSIETLIELLLRPAASLRRPGWALLIAGILLLVPGLLTDLIGLALIVRHFTSSSPARPSTDSDVIDVEYRVDDERR